MFGKKPSNAVALFVEKTKVVSPSTPIPTQPKVGRRMPAKGLYWRAQRAGPEQQQLMYDVTYNGLKVGSISRGYLGAPWNGEFEFDLYGSKFQAFTVDGYETVHECGKQLFRKLDRQVAQFGHSWP